MPKDAKLGLILGVSLVVTVAVVFFRKDALATRAHDEPPAATVVKPGLPSPPPVPRGQMRPTKARPATRSAGEGPAASGPRRHTVVEGETLAALAERYYGDKEKSGEIYRANREVLADPDALTPGTVLLIPELAADDDSAARAPGS
jgi:nucleoid-associated protein YgaU